MIRISKTVEFETELFCINTIIPVCTATLCCITYMLVTRTPPNIWVVGVSFNVCWMLSLRESMLCCYMQGQADALAQNPYLKPHMRSPIRPPGEATKDINSL